MIGRICRRRGRGLRGNWLDGRRHGTAEGVDEAEGVLISSRTLCGT